VVFRDGISGNATIRHHERRRRVVIQANGGYGRHILTNCIDYVLTFLDCFVALWAPRNDGFLSLCNNAT
jgi:hypothetical protein